MRPISGGGERWGALSRLEGLRICKQLFRFRNTTFLTGNGYQKVNSCRFTLS